MGLLSLGIKLALRASRPQSQPTHTLIVTQPVAAPYQRLTEDPPQQGSSGGGGAGTSGTEQGPPAYDAAQGTAYNAPPNPPLPPYTPQGQFGQAPYNPYVPMVTVVAPTVFQPAAQDPDPSCSYIATLIFSIISFFLVWPLGLPAVILAAIALSHNSSGSVTQARAQRTTAIVLLSIAFALGAILFFVVLSQVILVEKTADDYGTDYISGGRATTYDWKFPATTYDWRFPTSTDNSWNNWFSTSTPRWRDRTTTWSW